MLLGETCYKGQELNVQSCAGVVAHGCPCCLEKPVTKVQEVDVQSCGNSWSSGFMVIGSGSILFEMVLNA